MQRWERAWCVRGIAEKSVGQSELMVRRLETNEIRQEKPGSYWSGRKFLRFWFWLREDKLSNIGLSSKYFEKNHMIRFLF